MKKSGGMFGGFGRLVRGSSTAKVEDMNSDPTPDAPWGPQNTSTELMPPTRIFDARDSIDACITDCKVSKDGRYLVFTQRTGGCSFYQLSSGRNLFLKNADVSETLTCCALWTDPARDHEALRLLLGGSQAMLRVWDSASSREAVKPMETPQPICGCAWSADGAYALACGREFVHVFHVDSESVEFKQRRMGETIYCATFDPQARDASDRVFGARAAPCHAGVNILSALSLSLCRRRAGSRSAGATASSRCSSGRARAARRTVATVRTRRAVGSAATATRTAAAATAAAS